MSVAELFSKLLKELRGALNIAAAIGPLSRFIASLGEVDNPVNLGHCLIDVNERSIRFDGFSVEFVG